jgi:hypothetical protein
MMTRAMLRDDYASYRAGGTGVLLDDDGRSSVQTGIGDTQGPIVPGDPNPGAKVGPLVTVRERVSQGFDEDGNPMWGWTDVVADIESIATGDRTEVSDAAGTSTVRGSYTVLYPAEYRDVKESAQVRAEGFLWNVTKVTRFPDRITLDVERTDA